MKSLILLLPIALAAACGPQSQRNEGDVASANRPVVDSVLPAEVALARFRDPLPRVMALQGGADTRDSLVSGLIDALRANDTTAIGRSTINAREWGWLYYAESPLSRPPYELPPSLAWFQLQEENRKGAFRLLREFGGQPLRYDGYSCPDSARTEGRNHLWTGCRVNIGTEGTPVQPVRLFSTILERDGRYVFLSLQNGF